MTKSQISSGHCFANIHLKNEMKTGKLGNVYFHCKVECVKLVQPAFIPFLVVISPEIKPDLLDVHRHFLQNELGIV